MVAVLLEKVMGWVCLDTLEISQIPASHHYKIKQDKPTDAYRALITIN